MSSISILASVSSANVGDMMPFSARKPERRIQNDPLLPIDHSYIQSWRWMQYAAGGVCVCTSLFLWICILVDINITNKYALTTGESAIPGWVYAAAMGVTLLAEGMYCFFAVSAMTPRTTELEFTAICMLIGVVPGVIICGVFHFLLSTHPANTLVVILLIPNALVWGAFLCIWYRERTTAPSSTAGSSYHKVAS